MLPDQESPCCVLFDTMKSFASISNNDLATIVLSDKTYAGGRSLRDRAGDKTFLSRSIVHSQPGDLPESSFSDFEQSAYHVMSSMRSAPAAKKDDEIIDCLSGWASDDMAEALRSYSLDSGLFENTMNGLAALSSLPDADRAYLLVLMFLVTGCTQNPRRAADYTLSVAETRFGAHMLTQATQTFPAVSLDEDGGEDIRLALFRVIGNRMRGGPYPLSIDDEGTEIGYLSTSENSINDVEETVSRRHLKVFRAADGKWYVRGLNSRNGTVLVSGEDRSEVVVEPPRGQVEGYEPHDVRIQPGDRLKLARDTVFMVVQIEPGA